MARLLFGVASWSEPRTPLSREQLGNALKEQVELLRSYAASYDTGALVHAKPMSTALRVLLHDTSRSHALLGQMGVLTRISWLDTAGPIHQANLAPSMNLVSARITFLDEEGHIEPAYVPHLGGFQFPGAGRHLQFSSWWTGAVIRDGSRVDFSRRDLVLAVANTDGGAHVDRSLAVAYQQLSRMNSLGFGYESPVDGGEFGDPVLACIRQITYEVLQTLETTHLVDLA